MELLRKINFQPDDTLYILGDVIDRGEESVKCLKYVMETSNIHMLMGNHEQMMTDALTNKNKNSNYMANWLYNGGDKTLPGFLELPESEQNIIMNYIKNLPCMTEVKMDG